MALIKGTLDVLVLKALACAPMHAFEVAKWIEARSGGQLQLEDAALMQALHRLEERQFLVADWGTTENGRRARYYRPTAAGRTHLRAETKRLTSYVGALTAVLHDRPAEG